MRPFRFQSHMLGSSSHRPVLGPTCLCLSGSLVVWFTLA